MPPTSPALQINPDGTVDELQTPTSQALQRRCGGRRATMHLGRHAAVHPVDPELEPLLPMNAIARAVWSSLAGGSLAPALRGPVLLTGPAAADGSWTTLPEQTAAVVDHIVQQYRAAHSHPRVLISGAQLQGGRQEQCDTWAVHRDSGTYAFALLDGIGDHSRTRDHVLWYGPRLAQAAARCADPVVALTEIRRECLEEFNGSYDPYYDPSAAAVVVTYRLGSDHVRLAWTGDVRAYGLSQSGDVQLLTSDHNLAQYKRDRGAKPEPRDRHQLLSCLAYGLIGSADVERFRVQRLALCTDGAYHGPSDETESRAVGLIIDLAEGVRDAALSLAEHGIAAADKAGRRPDNATALVVEFPQLVARP